MPGPMPKPTVLRLVESGGRMRGRFKARAAQEPRPETPIGAPPRHLAADELEVWFRLLQAAPEGLLTGLDRDVFEGFVVLAAARARICAQYSATSREIFETVKDRENGPTRHILAYELREYRRFTEALRVLSHELGFTPAARTRIAIPPPEKEADPLADFLGGGKA